MSTTTKHTDERGAMTDRAVLRALVEAVRGASVRREHAPRIEAALTAAERVLAEEECCAAEGHAPELGGPLLAEPDTPTPLPAWDVDPDEEAEHAD